MAASIHEQVLRKSSKTSCVPLVCADRAHRNVAATEANTSQDTPIILEASEKMAKTPRMDPYLRLIYRLYEALNLLDLLGRVRGPQRIVAFDSSTLAIRRRFLKNLAFLCDYMKGGPSSTAVAVEDRANCNVFWISSNEEPSEDTRKFLEFVITTVKNSHALTESQKTQAENSLARKCVEFASMRVRKQARGLSSSARLCRQYLATHLIDHKGESSRTCRSMENMTLIHEF